MKDTSICGLLPVIAEQVWSSMATPLHAKNIINNNGIKFILKKTFLNFFSSFLRMSHVCLNYE